MAIAVAFQVEVTGQVRFALVVTVPAVNDAAVPVKLVPAPLNVPAVIVPSVVTLVTKAQFVLLKLTVILAAHRSAAACCK